jgi:hypothetical protein
MEDELIQTAVAAIKERAANPHPPTSAAARMLPAPGAMLDYGITLLKATNQEYLPALIHVLETLRPIVPG